MRVRQTITITLELAVDEGDADSVSDAIREATKTTVREWEGLEAIVVLSRRVDSEITRG